MIRSLLKILRVSHLAPAAFEKCPICKSRARGYSLYGVEHLGEAVLYGWSHGQNISVLHSTNESKHHTRHASLAGRPRSPPSFAPAALLVPVHLARLVVLGALLLAAVVGTGGSGWLGWVS